MTKFSLRVVGSANIGGVTRLHGRLEYGKILGGEAAVLMIGGDPVGVNVSSVGIVAGADGMTTVSLDRIVKKDCNGATLRAKE